jgi:hypothetical protein
MPATADQELLACRRSPRYRAAIWVARLGNALIFGYLLWTAASAVGGGSAAPILLGLAGAAVLVANVGLLYRAGIQSQFNRSREATGNALLRDIFAPRP